MDRSPLHSFITSRSCRYTGSHNSYTHNRGVVTPSCVPAGHKSGGTKLVQVGPKQKNEPQEVSIWGSVQKS